MATEFGPDQLARGRGRARPHSAAAEPGPARGDARKGGARGDWVDRRAGPRSRAASDRHVPIRDLARSRRAPDGPPPGVGATASRGRDAGQHLGHLHGQDGHVHPQPDDRPPRDHRRGNVRADRHRIRSHGRAPAGRAPRHTLVCAPRGTAGRGARVRRPSHLGPEPLADRRRSDRGCAARRRGQARSRPRRPGPARRPVSTRSPSPPSAAA